MKTMMLLSLNRATRLRFSYKIGIVTQPATIHLYIKKNGFPMVELDSMWYNSSVVAIQFLLNLK